jgi:hypothetical protein
MIILLLRLDTEKWGPPLLLKFITTELTVLVLESYNRTGSVLGAVRKCIQTR